MKKFLFFIISFLYVFTAYAQPDTTQHIIEGRTNSIEQQQKPYVILISIDGYRYDYTEKYNAVNIKKLSDEGVRAASMIPSYPSITFANHYTIATGLYPSHHGLISNHFYDPGRNAWYSLRDSDAVKDSRWYGGTPIWVLAEEQKMLSACFYWVGSEARIKDIYPTYYFTYNGIIPINRRIEIIKDWLQLPAEKRPHLITVYFPQVDHAGHRYGPESAQTASEVKLIDDAIGQLTDAVKSTGLPVNFILVSDHGMAKTDTERFIELPKVIDTSRFILVKDATFTMLYAKNKKDIKQTYRKLKKVSNKNEYTVYRAKKMPSYLHFSKKDDWHHRIGDIVLIAKAPKTFGGSVGAHGYDPYLVKDMHAIFYGWGPAFKSNVTIPSFENVDVYPVITNILGLKIDGKIDGTDKVAKEALK